MPDVTSDTFEIVVDGHTYTFKIPSIRFTMEVGYRASDIRRRCYPEFGGALGTLDMDCVYFARYCAIIELYLVRSSTGWVYGIADDNNLGVLDFAKPPAVDFDKFPANAEQLVFLVGEAFEKERERFRSRRNTNPKPPVPEAVAGQ